jgi:hypothetical protein
MQTFKRQFATQGRISVFMDALKHVWDYYEKSGKLSPGRHLWIIKVDEPDILN